MVTKKDVDAITISVCRGAKLFPTLKTLGISPLEFFKHLNEDPQAKAEFELARQIATEQMLESVHDGIDGIRTELDLKKVGMKLKANQWLAEKLIPTVYGASVNINVNKTIDIRAVLEDARSRSILTEGRKLEGGVGCHRGGLSETDE